MKKTAAVSQPLLNMLSPPVRLVPRCSQRRTSLESLVGFNTDSSAGKLRLMVRNRVGGCAAEIVKIRKHDLWNGFLEPIIRNPLRRESLGSQEESAGELPKRNHDNRKPNGTRRRHPGGLLDDVGRGPAERRFGPGPDRPRRYRRGRHQCEGTRSRRVG